MAGELDLDALVSGRRPLEEAAEALEDLAAGRALRTLLTDDAGTEDMSSMTAAAVTEHEEPTSSGSWACPRSSSSGSPTWCR